MYELASRGAGAYAYKMLRCATHVVMILGTICVDAGDSFGMLTFQLRKDSCPLSSLIMLNLERQSRSSVEKQGVHASSHRYSPCHYRGGLRMVDCCRNETYVTCPLYIPLIHWIFCPENANEHLCMRCVLSRSREEERSASAVAVDTETKAT